AHRGRCRPSAGVPMSEKIRFKDGWFATSKKDSMRLAHCQGLPAYMRLYFLAGARANDWGHATFKPGEAAAIVGVSAGNVGKLIGKLVKLRMVDPSSHAQCVVMAETHWDRQRGSKAWKCSHGRPQMAVEEEGAWSSAT